MQVQNLEVTSQSIDAALFLLAQLLDHDRKDLVRIVRAPGDYTPALISKGRGKKKRRIDIPPKDLMEVQRRLLARCLSRVEPASKEDWNVLTGYMPGLSICDNVAPHLCGKVFLQLDLSDAFPSVVTNMVREALVGLFEEKTIRRVFRRHSVIWFREAYLRCKGNLKNQPYDEGWNVLDMLYALREIIIWLTTLDEKLPQGAPTSPCLFNLVVAHQRLPTIVQSFQQENMFTVTTYADNLTISVQKGDISDGTVEAMISAVEQQTPFRVNRRKTRLSHAYQGSPHITGLSIGSRTNPTGATETFLTVPQEVQRRARGLLHRAIFEPHLRKEALGLAAHLLNVYGGKKRLPQQIDKPYQRLLETIQSQQ